MGPRVELNDIFLDICPNVYFQPPESVKLKYPCILYSLDIIDPRKADNRLYYQYKRYMVTIIDRDPDSELPLIIAKLQYAKHDRTYVADNLYHYVFTLYY